MTEQERDDRPFLSRWSERKRAVRAEEEAAVEAPSAEARAAAAAESEAERDANRAAAEAVDLESLTDKSDYQVFFRPGVPAVLKHKALQRLWRSNPVFAVLDGLNDHDLDYRWPEKGSEVVKTAWKVGRGFLTEADKAAKKLVAEPARDAENARPVPDAKAAPKAVPQPAPVAAAAEDSMPEPDAPEPMEEREDVAPLKTGLARRLDFAAFAKEGGEG